MNLSLLILWKHGKDIPETPPGLRETMEEINIRLHHINITFIYKLQIFGYTNLQANISLYMFCYTAFKKQNTHNGNTALLVLKCRKL